VDEADEVQVSLGADSETLRAAIFSFSVDQITAEVVSALDVAEIPSILMKGPAIATWLYSGDVPRLYTDTDLLLRRVDWEKAKREMEALGFEDDLGPMAHPRMEAGDGYPWGRSDGAGVDLHYTLFGIGADPEMLWGAFSRDSVREVVGGIKVAMPSHAARLLHIALHAVQHGGEAQLKPIMDLEHALAKGSRDQWEEAGQLAVQLDAVDAFSSGLRLLPDGERLADEIGAVAQSSAKTELRLGQVPLAEGFREVSEAPGIGAKLKIILRELFPTPAFMRWWKPVANRGPWGLAASYVWRPFWLASRALPGYRAWRRAKKA
jgi:hypothetical protein